MFRLRCEAIADNLANLESDIKAAAQSGGSSLDSFQNEALTTAVKDMDPPSPSTSTDTSSSDSGGDGSGELEPEPDMDFDLDSESEADGESEPDSETEDETDEEQTSGDDESEEKIKTESYRNLEPIPEGMELRLENFSWSAVSEGALASWNGITFVLGMLASVGLKYGPTALSGLFKVVLFTFARVFQLLTMVGSTCKERIERYLNSMEKQRERLNTNIESMTKVLESSSKLPDKVEFKFESPYFRGTRLDSETQTYRGNSGDMSSILKAQADFSVKTFGMLLGGARHEFAHLTEIANNRYIGKYFDALVYLNQKRSLPGTHPLTDSRLQAPEGTEFVDFGTMPAGGLRMIGAMPLESDNWPGVEKNYNAAEFRIVESTVVPGSIEACSPQELGEVMKAIDLMIDSNKKLQQFYENLAYARSGVLTAVRSLFIQLVQSKTRISFKDSVALPLFLKTSIATKVYLVAAMDLQDHNAKVIANALEYVERVQKLYRATK